MLLQRHNDEQALRIDKELVAAGGASSIRDESRTAMAEATAALGTARMPSLADRAVQADKEWRHRLAITANDDFAWSFRSNYTSLYRPASAMAHPCGRACGSSSIDRKQGS